MEAVLEELDNVQHVSLAGWGISSQEIKLLANRIATNTTLLSLSLANDQVCPMSFTTSSLPFPQKTKDETRSQLS